MINNPALGTGLQGLSGTAFFGSLLNTLIGGAFAIGIIIFFFTFVAGAIGWITSGGDKGKTEGARDKISKGIVGLFALLLVFVTVNLVGCVFGTNLLEFSIGEMHIGFGSSPMCGGGDEEIPPDCPICELDGELCCWPKACQSGICTTPV